MFGQEARLLIDLRFGISCDGSLTRSYQRYVKNMRKEFKAAYELAKATAKKKNDGNKKRYDQKIHYSHLSPGDGVLIWNCGLQGKQKLADSCKSMPYIVESQMSNLPVFWLRPEDGDGLVKSFHRNHLLPVGQKLQLLQDTKVVEQAQKNTLKKRKVKDRQNVGHKLKTATE